jgi:transcription initiation factor IIE alpha subunit
MFGIEQFRSSSEMAKDDNYKCTNPNCSYETYVTEATIAIRIDSGCPKCGSPMKKK